MGVSYSAVIGVGVDDDSIKLSDLTDNGLLILKEWFDESESFQSLLDEYRTDDEAEEVFNIPEDEYKDALEDYFEYACSEEDFLCEGLGLCAITGNLYQGWFGYRGINVNLNIETLSEDVVKATNKFKKVLKCEPELFHGVIVS